MIRNIPLGVYIPGNTVLHRLPPMAKLLGLMVFVIITAVVPKTLVVGLVLLIVPLVSYAIAKIPVRVAWGQIWPPLPILLALGAFQWWQHDLDFALGLILGIWSAMMMATILTLTTQLEAMMDAIERALQPTARIGVPVDAIVLAFSLTLRLIPLMLATVNEVLDARKARGLGMSLLAFGTPVVIRSMRRAMNIGDALIARGVGDD